MTVAVDIGDLLPKVVDGHVDAVRRLFVDRLTPEELDVVADVAEKVLAEMDGDVSTV